MVNDNPALLRYFLQDDLYLLKEDKNQYGVPLTELVSAPVEAPLLPLPEANQSTPVASLPETPKPAFKYLGGNKTNFLILVNYPAEQHMAQAHLKALESTLGRKALALDDVAILNISAHENDTYSDIAAYFSPEKLLILGAASIPAGLAVPQLNVIEQIENRWQLYTHSFDAMLADREMAKAFWEQMKNF